MRNYNFIENLKRRMKMKKIFKTLLAVAAVAVGTLVFSGADSEAATTFTANLQQTDCNTTSVSLKWDPYIGTQTVGHYHILYSTDGVNFGYKDYTSGTEDSITGLATGKKYYVKIQALADNKYHFEESDNFSVTNVIAESEMLEIATKPEVSAPTNVHQTAATATTASIAWDAVKGATSYTVYRRDSWSDRVKIGTTTSNKCTIAGLVNAFAADYVVEATADVVLNNGSSVISATSSTSSAVTVKTTPSKVLGVAMTNYYDSIDVAYFGWSNMNNCDGYQFQILTYKGKKLVDNYVSGNSIRISPFKKGVFTKTRVRAYVNVNGQKVFGAWSSNAYYASCSKLTVKRSANRKKINLSWKKISGVTQYQVYISTKSDGGYKKVANVSGSKNKITITKCGKSSLKKTKNYYIQVKYIGKVGGKKITSGIAGKGSI